MANKSVEFIKIELFKQGNKTEIDYHELKGLFEDIFKDHCILKKLDLFPDIKPDDIEPKYTLDIVSENPYLFGRICKQKSNNSVILRNYETLEADSVFDTEDAARKGIEVFTYFMFDYNTGILAIVNASDAPSPAVLNQVLAEYNKKYYMRQISIPNTDGVDVFLNSNKPELKALEFDIPSPSAEYLQKILGLDEDKICDMINEGVHSARIILKPVPYKSIVKETSKVRDIVNIIKENKNKYPEHVIVKGKSDDFGSRPFDLHAKYFSYPVTVNKTHIVEGKRIEYTLKEMDAQFKTGIVNAYELNYDILLALADREMDGDE